MNISASKIARAAMSIVLAISTSSALAAQECGEASWYAIRAQTASGEMMNPDAMTAAHPNLPFGAKVIVTNQANGRSVHLRINDRGPFVRKRIIDVSQAAAKELGFQRAGHTRVCITDAS